MIKKTVGGVVTSYVYNIEDRLTEVWNGDVGTGSLIASYYYDPFGRRLWKEVGGVRTVFHYADEGLIGEYDSAGNEIKTYGYKPGSTWTTDPLFMKEGGEYYFYHNDHLGTPQKLTAVNGAVVWRAEYSSFGKASVEVETVENNLRFPGQYEDAETGLHYNYHRYYDPEIGRYLTPDPIGTKGGVNNYSYSSNRPLVLSDSYGLRSLTSDFGGSFGFEFHALLGFGLDVHTCCAKNNKRWIVVTGKVCLGPALGASVGPNVQSSKKLSNCPDGYEGFTFEIGGGPFEGSISISDNPIAAIGITYGVGGKFTVCYTSIIYKKQKGCCEKDLWYL